MIMTILIILYTIVLLAQPQIAMWLQWHLDPIMKRAYPIEPWHQDQLASNSRSYQEHILNHAYLSMVALFCIQLNLYYGIIILSLSLIYPFIKEFLIDPFLMYKPINNIDWRQRLLGALLPMPLIIYWIVRSSV